MAKLLINLKRGKDESQLTITNKVTGKEVENSTVEIFKAMTEDRLVNFKIKELLSENDYFRCKIQSTIDIDSIVNFRVEFLNYNESDIKRYFDTVRSLSDMTIEDCKTKLVKMFEEKYQHGDINIIKSLYKNHLGDVDWRTTLEDIDGNTISNETVDILLYAIGKEFIKDNNISVKMSRATTDTIICSFVDSLGNEHIRNFKLETSLKQSWSLEKFRWFLGKINTYKNILIADIEEANKYNSIIEFEV